MISFLGTADCTQYCAETWREWHITKVILLCAGISMSVPAFYMSMTLPFAEFAPWIVSAWFIGVAGLLTAIYSLMLFWFSFQTEHETDMPTRRNACGSQSSEYILFFTTSSLQQPEVCVHAPSSSKDLLKETNEKIGQA